MEIASALLQAKPCFVKRLGPDNLPISEWGAAQPGIRASCDIQTNLKPQLVSLWSRCPEQFPNEVFGRRRGNNYLSVREREDNGLFWVSNERPIRAQGTVVVKTTD